uniref:Crossover junction endonuclease MUS81 n=2 Tax=Clastoptera arizonana TaxID=38151 RepID=A0A1B6CER1_9HEMI
MKRAKVKLKCPNPLFKQWLEEWRDEAIDRNSDLKHVYEKALKSLKKYPLPLSSGKECFVLEYFGPKICSQLDFKLAEYQKKESVLVGTCEIGILENNSSPGTKKEKKEYNFDKEAEKKKIDYVPTTRSSSYAILIALYINHINNKTAEMTKSELLSKAQDFTDTSMFKPQPGSYYTGWNSMSQLVKKQLVEKRGNPPKFCLTIEGLLLAKQLHILHTNSLNEVKNTTVKQSESLKSSTSKVITRKLVLPPKIDCPTPKEMPEVLSLTHPIATNEAEKYRQEPSKYQKDSLIFLPKTFKVILLVDTQETCKGDEIVKELKSLGILVEIRKLSVGDFTWICRNSSNQELVLPYIIERKRLDDLAKSIKDGRFHEQKFRLKQCGIPNCIYLVENYKEHLSLPLQTLLQAATNTQIIDNFTVKFTAGYKESIIYLSHLSSLFNNIFSPPTSIGWCCQMTFPLYTIFLLLATA